MHWSSEGMSIQVLAECNGGRMAESEAIVCALLRTGE
jgi:hypothetical protein